MQIIFQFLTGISDFFATVFSFDVIPGVTLFTILFYNLLLIVVFTALTRR